MKKVVWRGHNIREGRLLIQGGDYIYTHVYVCIYIYIYMYTCVYIYHIMCIYIYIYYLYMYIYNVMISSTSIYWFHLIYFQFPIFLELFLVIHSLLYFISGHFSNRSRTALVALRREPGAAMRSIDNSLN